MSETSRRSILFGGGVLAVAAVVAPSSTPAISTPFPFALLAPPSPEFAAYQKARDAHVDYYDSPDAQQSFPTRESMMAHEAEGDRLCDIRSAARKVIQNRPVNSLQDFVELAAVVQGELWDCGPDGIWDKHSYNDDLEEALQHATWKLITGGLHG